VRTFSRAEEGWDMSLALAIKQWTLAELHSLPDDGNKYELIRGELFVTPAPTDEHETILAKLTRILEPYAAANALGYVYHPRALLRFESSEAEPDLMVRQPHPRRKGSWESAPIPILVVEVQSPFTRRRDREQKREYYLDAGVAEYWMVDPEEQTIRVVRAERHDETIADQLSWQPAGTAVALTFDVGRLFD
jgi:Uma2 family endonuclease